MTTQLTHRPPSADSAQRRATITLPLFRHAIWLMPAAYVLHIAEEYIGNFPSWVTNDVHGSFDYLAFDLNNLMFMAILVTLVILNSRKSGPVRTFALVAFASGNLFWDGLFHLFMTPVLHQYSPGLVTAMLLYYPICILVGIIIVKQGIMTGRRFTLALAAGLALFAFVVWYGLFHFAI